MGLFQFRVMLFDVKEIQQFLCLASCYRRFIKNVAGIAGPLHTLIPKGHRLKSALSTPSIMAHPHFDRPFLLDVDASRITSTFKAPR
ncbi:hypothetical protein T03_5674 [Trichinella britovi]|uniref:Uncharacterized protein n=1 Tax=Trichinella britovi TaxID=45882 RepID=A0A0V1CCR7_TRIBR|nr:hypothetical protein T03_5674 [Trichinella britovi]